MSFTEKQTRALTARLSHRHVRTRSQSGTVIPYVEGWHAISEANRIFGFDSWDRVTLSPKCVWTTKERGLVSCFYLSKVRITVRAGDTVTVREGVGTGFAANASAELAHELALKAAETDATKRALATFGNPFGLALYDKSGTRVTKPRETKRVGVTLTLNGGRLTSSHDVNAFVTEVRRILREAKSTEDVYEFWGENIASLTALRDRLPFGGDLVISFLVNCFKSRLRELGPGIRVEEERIASIGQAGRESNTKDICADGQISKEQPLASQTTSLAGKPQPATSLNVTKRTPLLKERRIRNKAHLAYVAQQPCLVCERKPTHAHHIRFAQQRAMGLKVSDEYTVPLCATHHDQLHRAGDERVWWEDVGIKDPLGYARHFWLRTQGRKEEEHSEFARAAAENVNPGPASGEQVQQLTQAPPSEEPVRIKDAERIDP